MEALLEARRAAAREKDFSIASTDVGGATDAANIDPQLAAVDRRLDAYVSIPVVSTLLFGAALSIVFDRELIEHLEGCGHHDSSTSGVADASCRYPIFDYLATAFMHLAVGLNLVSTMILIAVFYFGKRTLGYEEPPTGHGDWIRRTKRFLDSNGTRFLLLVSFYCFIFSIPFFGLGLVSTIWVLLPTRGDVASIASAIYVLCITLALGGFFTIYFLATEQWDLRELPEDVQKMQAMEAEIAELDELSRDREIAELSCKIEREVALARGDAAGARTLAGPPRGLSVISSGAQLGDLVPADSLEVVAPEPEPEPETRG